MTPRPVSLGLQVTHLSLLSTLIPQDLAPAWSQRGDGTDRGQDLEPSSDCVTLGLISLSDKAIEAPAFQVCGVGGGVTSNRRPSPPQELSVLTGSQPAVLNGRRL